MGIQRSKIVMLTDDVCVIEWEGTSGFGHLELQHIPKTGDYVLKAEFMGIESIIKIIKLLNDGDSEKK